MHLSKLTVMALALTITLLSISAQAACNLTDTDFLACLDNFNLTELAEAVGSGDITGDDACTAYTELMTDTFGCYKDADCSGEFNAACTSDVDAYSSTINCTLSCDSIAAGPSGGVQVLTVGVVSSIVTVTMGVMVL